MKFSQPAAPEGTVTVAELATVYEAIPKSAAVDGANGLRDTFLEACVHPAPDAVREAFWRVVNDREAEQRATASATAGVGGAGEALTFRRLSDVVAAVDGRPPRSWLFAPVLVEGDYGVMSAEDKAGKTWAVLDAAVSCASGTPWLGQFECRKRGTVLVFFGEGSDAKLVRRIRAVAKSKGLTEAQAETLDIVACFRAPHLNNAIHRESIRAAVKEHGPSLIIIDPLYLAAAGAKSSDLFSMGVLLGSIQVIAQESGAALLISHHWNKGGTGDGHDRSSGVGPGAWGRFLISIGIKGKSATDPETQESAVRQRWQFRGDEQPDTDTYLIRRVRAENPDDLTSPMTYSVELSDGADRDSDQGGGRLAPAAQKVSEALSDTPQTIREITDKVSQKYGHGLRRQTVSTALNDLAQRGLAEVFDIGSRNENMWIRTAITPD